MDAFRAAVPQDHGCKAVANRLCAIGTYHGLRPDEEVPTPTRQDYLVYIASGAAKLVSLEDRDRPVPLRGHILGFQFGGDIVSILRKPQGGSRLQALTELQVITFAADEFLDIAQADPGMLRAVLTKSLDSLQRTRARMILIGHQTARQRIAGFLANMAERTCGCISGSCEIALPMSRSDIADSLGLTIETVSRQFTELRKSRLITTPSRAVVNLPDIDTLKQEAGL